MAVGPVTAFRLVRSQGWEAGAHGRKSPTNCSSLSVKPGSVPMGPTEEKGGEWVSSEPPHPQNTQQSWESQSTAHAETRGKCPQVTDVHKHLRVSDYAGRVAAVSSAVEGRTGTTKVGLERESRAQEMRRGRQRLQAAPPKNMQFPELKKDSN